jgi:signal transduction histidine kinase
LIEKEKVITLTKIAERAELASTIHDTIGHRLTGLIMEMEMIKLLNKSSGEINEKRDLMMDDATENAREVLKSLRVLVSSLNESNKEEITYDYLNEKIQEFSFRTGIKIDFICNLPFDDISIKIKNDIYRTIMEAITNSAKHSKTKKIDIKINSLEENGLILNIYDYGKVEGVISEGNGINFMRKRISLLGGKFFYKADKSGFKITIELREVYND